MLTVVYIRKPVRFSSAMAGVSSKPLKSRQLILSTPFARFRKLCRIIGNRIVFDTGKPDGSTFSETAVQIL